MDIYDTLAYMSLKEDDFPFNTGSVPTNNEYSSMEQPLRAFEEAEHNPFGNDDLVIVDNDDTIDIPKQEKKMKRIHIEDAQIKPFHYRFDKNIEPNNETNNQIRTRSKRKTSSTKK